MEARLLEINSQVEKMILLLGGEISQEVQAEEEQAEEVQAGEVQPEEVQEFKEDQMPQEEPQEHPALPEACLEQVPEEPELIVCEKAPEQDEIKIAVSSENGNEEAKTVDAVPEATTEEKEVDIDVCSAIKKEEQQAVADDREMI